MDLKNKESSEMSEMFFLKNDSGVELWFHGKIFSESSYYDEDTSSLTRLRLFAADGGLIVYSVISGSGKNKTRRHYTVRMLKPDSCEMSDGSLTITVSMDMLFSSVFGLCGIDPARADELRPVFEETLNAANI